MATKAIIKCKKCSEEFPIYWSNVKHEPICCPNCFAELEENLSEQVYAAMGMVHDVNREILKSNLENDSASFEVSIHHSAYPTSD